MTNSNAQALLEKSYFRNEEKTWGDLCKRVAHAISIAEETPSKQKEYEETFYNMMESMDFIPSSPCLMNAGTTNQQLSSCFILDIQDNLESIYGNVKTEMAKIFQKNGGVGFNISALRPSNSPVETAKGYSCGALGFMEEFDLTADIVTRNNQRKGAIKIDMSDFHPDIEEFIKCKDDTNKYTHMNISVALSDKFMNAVKNNEKWDLRFPNFSVCKDIYNKEWDGDITSWEEKGYPVKVYKTINAKDLYYQIMQHAWKTGEPGVSFLDNMNRDNPNPKLGKTTKTNPCSEFVSIPYNSCNLGSINLSNFVANGKIEYDGIEACISYAVRFLDDMITVNNLPLEKLETITKNVRSIGLGTMGLADMLYKLNLPYNAQETLDFLNKLYANIQQLAKAESERLAREKGVYGYYKDSVFDKNNILRRNSNLISIAPNGSISFIANTSGGLEPNFALVYTRRTNDNTIYHVVNPVFEQYLKENNLYTKEILQKIADNNGSCQGIDEIPQHMQKIFVTAHDITPNEHLSVLTAIQQYVDLACSKTINLSHDATVADIEDIYLQAWDNGIKGITVYRDGARENQTLSAKRQEESSKTILARGDWRPKAKDTTYYQRKLTIGCGKLSLFIGWSDNEKCIQDFYVTRSGQGGCERLLQSTAISMSAILRLGGDIKNIEKAFRGIGGCNSFATQRGKGHNLSKGNSCGIAILNEIKAFLAEKQDKNNNVKLPTESKKEEIIHKNNEEVKQNAMTKCPECGEYALVTEGGCNSCKNCGYSRCG